MTDKGWKKHFKTDPYPGIAPSLLNSADIHRYASLGALVHPYSANRRKPASYELRFLGALHRYVAVDPAFHHRKWHIRTLKEGETATLPQNSIVYINLEEEFRLPDFIAARFNLHIRHVHKGISLGTGPLVDPGFEGRLLVPLHNLTNNDYVLEVGEGIIWVEFTKISPHSAWSNAPPADDRGLVDVVRFPKEKKERSARDYLKSAAVLQQGVESSIGSALEDSQRSAKLAERHANRVAKISWIAAIVGGLSLLIALAAVVLASWQVVISAQQLVENVQEIMLDDRRIKDRYEAQDTTPERQRDVPMDVGAGRNTRRSPTNSDAHNESDVGKSDPAGEVSMQPATPGG